MTPTASFKSENKFVNKFSKAFDVINYVLEDITDPDFANAYGFSLDDKVQKLTAMNFADDTANLSDSKEGLIKIVQKTIELFSFSGLQINPDKSICICIKDGVLVTDAVQLSRDDSIPSLQEGDTVKYLGVDFNSELTFVPSKIIDNLNKMLNNLVSTPMLRPHQKIIIINDYIWPVLIYPLQMAPLHKLPKSFLMDVDRIIRSSVKEILGIPTDTPNAMLYTSKNLRGLSITKAEWEAFLQHYNICMVLLGSNDMYVPYAKDLEDELNQCEKALNFSDEELDKLNNPKAKSKITKRMRIMLREKEFEMWSQMRLRGAGVCQFKDNPNGNKLLMNKSGLTTSEWVTTLKMNANVSSVRVIPGRSLDGTQCRHCGAEKESLGHVLGSCVRGELIRNNRHHGIREILAKAFLDKGFVVEQEVHCVAENGSTRRVDIIAYCPSSKIGYILDPTIRFEYGDSEQQATAVDLEKKEIYEPCVKYFMEKWSLRSVEVVGLYVGARGTITSFFKSWAKSFGIKQTVLDDILLFALRGSIQIYNHHLYV